jgi:hypothetical protein
LIQLSASLIVNLLDPAVVAAEDVISMAIFGANAEISSYSADTSYLYTVGSGSGAIVVSDLTDPSNLTSIAIARPEGGVETLQGVAVFRKLLAIAVQNKIKTEPGFVQFYDLTNSATNLSEQRHSWFPAQCGEVQC